MHISRRKLVAAGGAMAAIPGSIWRCTLVHAGTQPNVMYLSSTSAWNAIASRDFRGWRGLPADADYADFDARFPRLADGEARGRLGRTYKEAYYRMHVAEGYPQNLQAWRRGSRLILIDAKLPQLRHSLDELRSELGTPAAKLKWSLDVWDIPHGAHIYPERGIALFIGDEQLLRLRLFAPCTLIEYQDTLHDETELVERPLGAW